MRMEMERVAFSLACSMSSSSTFGSVLAIFDPAAYGDPAANLSLMGEMRRSIYNLQMILEAAGSGLKHVVQTRNYVHDPANLSLFNQIYRELFIEPYPARTTITQCLTEALKFEIECVAVIK